QFAGDDVSVSTAGATGTFADKNFGLSKPVTVSGLSLSGAAAGNYAIGSVSPVTARITQKGLTITGLTAPSSKVYDGTTTATVTGTAALLAAETPAFGTGGDGKPYVVDTVSVTGTPTGTYNSKDVATATTVTVAGLSLSGGNSGNYSVASVSF